MTIEGEAYALLVEPHLAPGFSFRELVWEGSKNRELPPRKHWNNIIGALQAANRIRLRMKERGAHGILLHAAYRPKGGAVFSAHKTNYAVDIDLMAGDYDLAGEFVEEGVRELCSPGSNIRLGIYGRPGSEKSIRLHVDTKKGARGWQHYGGRELSLAKSDIPRVARRLGLVVPGQKFGVDE